MGEEDLVLVMANGLHYYDQEGTRGNSVTYKLILKCCECFRKLTTMKKYSSVYFFFNLLLLHFLFCLQLFCFFLVEIARAIFNTKLDASMVQPKCFWILGKVGSNFRWKFAG